MKILLLAALMVVSTAVQPQSVAPTSPVARATQARVLTRAEFDELLKKPEQILIIDVRRPDEIRDIGGFPVFLSIQFSDLETSLSWIPKNRQIITVSNHAARGGRAAELLAKNGFNVIGTIGAQTYEEQGGKLSKVVPPTPPDSAKKKSP